MRKPGVVLAITAMLAACVPQGTPGAAPPGTIGANNTTGGAIVGGIAGAIVGSAFGRGSGQAVAMGVGALLGAAVGSQVGASMDRADLYRAQQAQQAALYTPPGQPVAWSNPENGHYGTITPMRDYTNGGQNCREFQQSITVEGRTQQGYGTACQMPDGSWRVVQ